MDETTIKRWYFDNYPDHRKDSRGTDKRSWVQLSDTDVGQKVEVFLREKPVLLIDGELDQWGTWIGIGIPNDGSLAHKDYEGFTVAQEWSTKSFIQALMSALIEFAKICDLEGKTERQTPEYEELKQPPIV